MHKSLLLFILFILYSFQTICEETTTFSYIFSDSSKVVNHDNLESNKSFKFKLDSLQEVLDNSAEKDKPLIYNEISELFLSYDKLDKTIEYGKKALEFSGKLNNSKQQHRAEKNIGIAYYRSSDFPNSIIYLRKAFEYYNSQNDLEISLDLDNYLGGSYYYTGQYEKAYQHFLNRHKYFTKTSDTALIANTLLNIGNIYLNWREYDKALDHFNQALQLNQQIKETAGIAGAYNNIANVYFETGDFEKTIEHNFKSLRIKKELGDSLGVATSYNNIAGVYFEHEKYQKALDFYEKALKIYKKTNDKMWMAMVYNNMGFTYEFLNKPHKALKNYEIALKFAKETSYKEQLLFTYESFSEVYRSLGNYKKAFLYLENYKNLKDSIFDEEKHKQMVEMEAKFENEEKQKEIELLNKEARLQEEKIKRKNIVIYAFVAIVLLMGLLIFFIWRSFYLKRKANILLKEQNEEIREKNEELKQQREEIESQRDEIEFQRDKVLKQKNQISHVFGEINASIKYASTIQKALLPPNEFINNIFRENFILFRPKESVSGDFYWIERKDHLKMIAIADCTGHGVPGAFLSVLGMTALNEIYYNNNNKDLKASEFLNNLKEKVIKALHQTQSEKHPRDSMEMSICLIDTKNRIINFSGSYNPMILIHNNELQEIKADRLPIGYHPLLNHPFSDKYMEYCEGDCLYLFTDGYADQKNHITGKKFLKARFKRFLFEIYQLPDHEQKEQLAKNFEYWKGNSEQIDDVLVAGIRL